jgi:hypothetical protein
MSCTLHLLGYWPVARRGRVSTELQVFKKKPPTLVLKQREEKIFTERWSHDVEDRPGREDHVDRVYVLLRP